MSRLNDIKAMPVSDATRRRNPGLFTAAGVAHKAQAALAGELVENAFLGLNKRRLRQDSKPLMNTLETRLLTYLQSKYAGVTIRPQAKRYRLANGLWYKADFTAIIAGVEHAWEAKGPKAFRGGFENLKIAATQWPDVVFTLMWEESGVWLDQRILA